MKSPAIVLANRLFKTPNGKVAHGLIRGSDRYQVTAVVDPDCAGEDAGESLDNVRREIPIVASLAEALSVSEQAPRYCVVGIATHGGHFTEEMRGTVLEAVKRGLTIVNGLHDVASEDAEIAAAAEAAGGELIDLRKSPAKSTLHFWEGDIQHVRAPRVAVLGTDCALGKRTTTRLLVQALNDSGMRAEMIYTGQTGWMQGARYGFVFDSVINDYVSGEVEHAIVTCDREVEPDIMVIEGQSSLRNPSGPCGAEFLLSGGARGVVLQHATGREFFEGYEEQQLRIPAVADEIALIAMYGARTLAVTLNGAHVSGDELIAQQQAYEHELGIPVLRPLEEGLDRLVPVMQEYIEEQRR
ncbi:MAG: DUF1611 domain-containing protein [Proteobacteria bacterium]|nr:DUF1611 domain-containing protein [Pseudomonadota bacterium]